MACDSPLTVDAKKINGIHTENRTYPVPCGKCPPCKKSRVAGWRFRMLQEEKIAHNVHFITLTYDTTCIPITKNGFMTLSKSSTIWSNKKQKLIKISDDLTLFFKQLRNLQTRSKMIPKQWQPIKYYSCAEYGEKKSRPHYHIILFNLYDVNDIGKAWQKGMVDIEQEAKAGSFAYAAGYINKEKRIPQHKNDDRVREYSRISQKLGANYLNKANVKWHLADVKNRCYVNEGNKKLPMPKYYKDKIYSANQKLLLQEKAQEVQAENEKLILKKFESIETYHNNKKQGRYDKFYHFKKVRE